MKEKRRIYTVNLDADGKVESILLEVENSYCRELYKRNPRQHELRLTDEVFEEAMETVCDNGILSLEELYARICDTDEYYTELLIKSYKNYLKKVVFNTKIHKDAFWN